MKYLVFLFLLFYNTIGLAQTGDTAIKLEKTIKTQAEDFYVDALGNLYIITSKQQLKKLNAKGDSLAVFNFTKRLGKLSYMDVTYPMKSLIYFKDYSTIITVDRLLNSTNTIDLRKQSIFQANTIAASYDNQFWFYDEQLAKLKKINNQGTITQQTVDLRQLIKEAPTPQKIIENNNTVYVYDSAKGVYSFDYYGAYKKFTVFKGYENIFIYNSFFYAIKNNVLYKYSEKTATTNTINLPIIAKTKKIVIEKNKIYYLHANGISIYTTP